MLGCVNSAPRQPGRPITQPSLRLFWHVGLHYWGVELSPSFSLRICVLCFQKVINSNLAEQRIHYDCSMEHVEARNSSTLISALLLHPVLFSTFQLQTSWYSANQLVLGNKSIEVGKVKVALFPQLGFVFLCQNLIIPTREKEKRKATLARCQPGFEAPGEEVSFWLSLQLRWLLIHLCKALTACWQAPREEVSFWHNSPFPK